MTEPHGPSGFPTTRWGRVVEAAVGDSPEARDALAELCRAYWYPIYAFIRRRGHGPDDALDLTQDFFARLLERNILASADPVRGRFRTFLRAVCSDYLSNRSDRDNAEKRGGGRPVFSIDAPEAEGRYVLEPAHERTSEWLFERDWALTLLRIVLDRLRREYHEAGRRRSSRSCGSSSPMAPAPSPTRRSPGGWASAKGPWPSPSIGSAAAMANCSASRSRPPSTTRPRSTTRSAPSSPRSGPEIGKKRRDR